MNTSSATKSFLAMDNWKMEHDNPYVCMREERPSLPSWRSTCDLNEALPARRVSYGFAWWTRWPSLSQDGDNETFAFGTWRHPLFGYSVRWLPIRMLKHPCALSCHNLRYYRMPFALRQYPITGFPAKHPQKFAISCAHSDSNNSRDHPPCLQELSTTNTLLCRPS